MDTGDNSRDLTIDSREVVLSARSVVVPTVGRGEDLRVRVSAPATGQHLPVIIFSHGHGSSMDGYAPLVDHWAAQGFVVVQPTHLDSRRIALAPDDPRRKRLWRIRIDDMRSVMDHLAHIEEALPGLAGRVDRTSLAAAGHSFGGQTVSLLLGARMVADLDGQGEDMSDDRLKAGVLLAAGGRGGDALSAFAAEQLPYLNTNFDHLATPTLVVAGDADRSPLTVLGPEWFYDPFYLSPGARALVRLSGGEHMLGGISGYGAAETTDEDVARVTLVQRLTTAFLNTALGRNKFAWPTEVASAGGSSALVSTKPN